MANLKAIRNRIGSVKNTQQITRAMKMVAAAKLRRAQDALMQGRPYAQGLAETIQRLAVSVDEELHPLMQRSDSTRTLLVVVTSDRGLCGAFNSSINRAAEALIKEKLGTEFESVDLAIIGRKGNDYLRRRTEKLGTRIEHFFQDVYTDLSIETVKEICDVLTSDFVEGKYDQVYVLYNEFKSAIAQETQVERLLPLSPDELGNEDAESIEDYDFEPAPKELFSYLLPLYINKQVYRILQESVASEMGARMTAMDSATNNASDLIAKLTLEFNRARQAAITTEIIEIVSGANAL
jgi:F-type H+-transporting ATPase subunit gamma